MPEMTFAELMYKLIQEKEELIRQNEALKKRIDELEKTENEKTGEPLKK